MQSITVYGSTAEKLLPQLLGNDGWDKLINRVKVAGITVYRKARKVVIKLSSDVFIPMQALEEFERAFAGLLGSDSVSVDIRVRYEMDKPLEELLKEYWDSILYLINRQVAVSKGIMAGCGFELDGKRLIINLRTIGSEILKSNRCDVQLEDLIEELFSKRVKAVFKDLPIDQSDKEEYIKIKEEEEWRVIENAISEMAPKKKKSARKKSRGAEADPDTATVISGRDFSDAATEMAEVTRMMSNGFQELGKIAIKGDVFRVEFKELRNEKHLWVFDVTDYTGSLSVKFFADKNDFELIAGTLQEGIAVKVRGEAIYDKFMKDIIIQASDVVQVHRESRQDTAQVKRVELHAHTQMSAMDGVASADQLVKRAAEWGHKAIAITDHGVVQAYPEAYEAGKKHGVKIIYGVECYLVDDDPPVVINGEGRPLDGEFVVIDVETTGLDSYRDRITEIGAVKIRNFAIVDTFSTFVNPEIPIPAYVSQMTGITDETVKDAPVITQVLPGFASFIGDAVLVAHNAAFDVSFLKNSAERSGITFNNPVLDTLQLVRRMFPELQRHRLDLVAKHLGVSLEHHHRAVDDSRAAADILLKCFEILRKKGVRLIDRIDRVLGRETDYKSAETCHAVILVRNTTGLKNLYKIISHSHLDYFYKKPRVPKRLFTAHRDGLLIGTACAYGELYSALLKGRSDDELARLVSFYDYLEIQPLDNNRFLLENARVKSLEDLKDLNLRILNLGKKFRKPVVATCDIHFIEPRDEVFRRILMSGQGYDDADSQAPLYFRTTREMLEEFSYLGEKEAYEVVVTNTNLIADMIEELAPIPAGTYPPKIDGAEEEIKSLAERKAAEIYGDPLPPIVKERLDKELSSIIKNGFAVMYLIAQKLVEKSLKDGYLVGSRGSVGSSLVAYMIGITEVNSLQPHYICEKCKHSEFITDGSYDCGFDMPDKNCPDCGSLMKKDGYDIPFETFLGFEGDKEPDIDLNFSGDYQPVVHKYVEELFGQGHVFRAGTISSVADKTAFGFVKNYLEEKQMVVTNAELNRLIKGCTGTKRTTGQHPGGIMIIPQDREIYDFSPIQHPADDPVSGTITTHFDYNFLHGSILKLDILGHTVPTTIKMLEDLTGVNARAIPLDDRETLSLFSSTEPLGVTPEEIGTEVGTFGIPEFGTGFSISMLVETKPKLFSELIRISGLSHGESVWLGNAQDLIRSGTAELSQCICCRDDIMLYLKYKGLPPRDAFRIMEDVRKGKGIREEDEEIMLANGVPQWYIDSCKKIKYMFPKAHAAAYTMMAFRIAWFKVHYPEAFYATYFTVFADDFDANLMTRGREVVWSKLKELEARRKDNTITQREKDTATMLEVVNEMYARGIKLLPVDLYKSDPFRFQITGDGIRPPLFALQGLGEAAAQNIAEARKEGEFLSKEDLRLRARISKAVVEILDEHGCLDELPESSQLRLF